MEAHATTILEMQFSKKIIYYSLCIYQIGLQSTYVKVKFEFKSRFVYHHTTMTGAG